MLDKNSYISLLFGVFITKGKNIYSFKKNYFKILIRSKFIPIKNRYTYFNPK